MFALRVLFSFLLVGERERERAALPVDGTNRNRSSELLHDRLADREAKANAVLVHPRAFFFAREELEETVDALSLDADARVLHVHAQKLPVVFDDAFDGDPTNSHDASVT